MEKQIRDRLNHLKSNLAQEKHQKLRKVLSEERIQELEIRIDELNMLWKKIK